MKHIGAFERKKRGAGAATRRHDRRMTTQPKIMPPPAGDDAADPLIALDREGWAVLPGLLDASACDGLSRLYDAPAGFRSHVHMARHGFGRGEYRYFAYPLPPLVEALRGMLYARLAPIANRWHERMGMAARFPAEHAEFLARCHEAGQRRPTPLLLQYGAGDYN